MQDKSTDHYAVLGVAPDATPEELSRAYRRIVKAHPPESPGDTFRLASEAYRVLCHPERRRAYDAQERLPPAVDLRLRQITGRLQTHAAGAEEELRALCREHFTLRAPRFVLGQLLDRTGRHEEAADVFDLLFAESPNEATYARCLGDVLVKTGDEQNGIAHLKQAIVLDGDDHEAYACLVRAHLQAGRLREALDVVEHGIGADRVVDIRDVHLLVQKVLVQARLGDADGMRATGAQIDAAIPAEDDEARRWTATRLQAVCRSLESVGRTHLTGVVLETARVLDPELAVADDAQGPVADPSRGLDARAALLGDPEVAPWIKTVVKLADLDTSAESLEGWRDVMARRLGREPEVVETEWAAASSRHDAVLAPLRRLWPTAARPAASSAPPADAAPPERPLAAPPAPVRRTRGARSPGARGRGRSRRPRRRR